MASPELRVVDDIAASAVDLFLESSPRTVVLSGGSTPRPFYERLASADHPWAETEVFLSDERCVPADDARSNIRMIREALLSKVPATEHPIDGAGCDAWGYERALRERFGTTPRFDLAVLGLGPDGHTASLFPGRPDIEEREHWVVHVEEPGLEPLVPRVTLTLPLLSATSVAMFLVAGAGKREALERLVAADPAIPAARVAAGRVVILADRDAAGR